MTANGITVRRKRRVSPPNKENESSIQPFLAEFQASTNDKDLLALAESIVEASLNRNIQMVLADHIDEIVSKARDIVKKATSGHDVLGGLVVAVHLLRAVWTLERHRDLLIRLLYHIVTTASKVKGKESIKLLDYGLAALETLASAMGGLVSQSENGTFFEFRRGEHNFPTPILRKTTKREKSSLTSDQILSIGIASMQAGAQMLAKTLTFAKQSGTDFLSNLLKAKDTVKSIESLLIHAQTPWVQALSSSKEDVLEIHMKQSRKILTDMAKTHSEHRSKLYALAIRVKIDLSIQTQEQVGKICRAANQYGKTLEGDEMASYHSQVGDLLDKVTDPTQLPQAYVEYCAHRARHTNIRGNRCKSDCCFEEASTRFNHICGAAPANSNEHFLLVFSMMLQLKEALSTESNGTFSMDPVEVEHRVDDFMTSQHSDCAKEFYCKMFAMIGLETTLRDHVKERPLQSREVESAISVLANCVGPLSLDVAQHCAKPGPFISLCTWAFSESIAAMDVLDKPNWSVVAMIFELDLPNQICERLGRLLYAQATLRREKALNCCTHMSYGLAFLHKVPNAAEYKISDRLSVLSSMFTNEGDPDRALLALVTSIAMELQESPRSKRSAAFKSDGAVLSLVQRCSTILLGQCLPDIGNKLSKRIRELGAILRHRPIHRCHNESKKQISIEGSLSLLCGASTLKVCQCSSVFCVESVFQGIIAPDKVNANDSIAFVAQVLRVFGNVDGGSESLQTVSHNLYASAICQIKTLQLDESDQLLLLSLLRLALTLSKDRQHLAGSMEPESIAETIEELWEIHDDLQAIQQRTTSFSRLASITVGALKLEVFDILRRTEKNDCFKPNENLDLSDLIQSCFSVLSCSTNEESDLEAFVRQSTIACLLRLSEIQLLHGEDIDALITLKKLSNSPMIKECAFVVNASIYTLLASDRISSGLVTASIESLSDSDDDKLVCASLLRYQACIDEDREHVKNCILRMDDEVKVRINERGIKTDIFNGCIEACLSMGLAECSGRIGDAHGELDSLFRCLDKTKTIISHLSKSIDSEELTSFCTQALHWHFGYRCHERKIDCLRRISDVYLRLGDYSNCLLYTLRYGNAIIGSPFSTCLRKDTHDNRFENIVRMLFTTRPQSLQDHRWRRQLLHLASHCFASKNVAETISKFRDQMLEFGKKLPTSCYYREIEVFKDASEVHRILRGHDLSIEYCNDVITDQSSTIVGECLSNAVRDNTLSVYDQVLPQLICDQRLDAMTNTQNPRKLYADQFHLEKNATTLGCTNVTKCWSLYLLGLSALNEAKASGELRDLWNGKDGRQLKHVYNARQFLEMGLTNLGSSTTDLKRKTQRSLALVLGPNESSDILQITSAELIHLSLNEGNWNRYINNSYSDVKVESRIALYIQRLKETKRNIPDGLQIMALASCPTGELLLHIIDSPDDDSTCCIFSPSSESISDFLLRPLSDLLESNNDQLESSGRLNREDSAAKRNWRRERRDMDEAFAELMERAKDLFESANLPPKCQHFLFRKSNRNLCTRFEEVADENNNKTTQKSETCLVLILDELLQKFPFESLEFFEDRAVCRLPSLFYISQSSSSFARLNHDRVSYILNPESDLDDTEERLLPLLQDLGRNQWDSYVKEKPPGSEISKALSRKEGLIMYFGHGGGERVISKEQLKAVGNGDKGVCAAIILMGCSSGLVHSPNQDKGSCSPCTVHFEPDGLVLQYLLLGSPCAIGNLWDVTDRDIDLFTDKMLKSLFDDGQSTAQSVASARKACKYRFLTGAAPVCYGLPAYVYHKAKMNPRN